LSTFSPVLPQHKATFRQARLVGLEFLHLCQQLIAPLLLVSLELLPRIEPFWLTMQNRDEIAALTR
jgi:hypothetical protein